MLKLKSERISFIIVSIFLIFFALEIFFGIVFFLKDARHQILYLEGTIDYPYLYYSFKSDKSNFINDDGLYSKSTRMKDPQDYRIILAGGSTARSSAAPYKETIASYLQKELNKRFKTERIEVINAGISGYVLEQEFIFIQLLLQHYNPDMIIGLDGFNDLVSFKLNKYIKCVSLPHNWRDIKVIQRGKAERKFYFRLKVLFRNLVRAYEFAKTVAKGESSYDYSSVTDKRIEEVSGAYVRILEDIHDFSASKNIRFYTFLQPAKWYVPNGSPVRFDAIPELAKLYRKYDEKVKGLPYGFSLTSIFENNLDLYTDDCHVIPAANSVFAKAMADFLENKLVKDAKFKHLILNNR
ncbi:MAG: hypothetical protein KJ593_05970 [Candidatus Omnitrophica bacterium]|nr:hypothetical protein [Candidatus Omnitrophota bacterium]